MKVAKDLVVSLAYQVRTEDGVLVDESPVSAPLDYLHGHGSLISGLENALDGHDVGDKFDVEVGANDAYGQYDENLVQRVPKDVFMGVDELQVGMRFLAETDQGPVPVEITEVGDEHVVVDGNHMLAGQNLKFNVEVVAIREATAEELEHGHVHGAHGHDHGHDHDHDGCCGGHGHDHEHGKGGCGGNGGWGGVSGPVPGAGGGEGGRPLPLIPQRSRCALWNRKKRGNPLFLRLNSAAGAFLPPVKPYATAEWLSVFRPSGAYVRASSPFLSRGQ